MRLWSLHPSYLDTKGLVAVWREGLLALHVLRGQTKGYLKHPQLIRFRSHPQPLAAISNYLHEIVDEAEKRKFTFKREKLEPRQFIESIPVTLGQLEYEFKHLQKKLEKRDQPRFDIHKVLKTLKPHSSFKIVPGEIEPWEKYVKKTA